ncbi:MAG: DUF5615 family PIN-like protein [Ignavibacteria bacterium]|nr:DUF5615 family PIN-like protein [Ignavibacteria bacterium]
MKDKKYLIDVNLPYLFSIWNQNDYIHQKDIDDEWSDDLIWNYAKKNRLTIISKDADFFKTEYYSKITWVIHSLKLNLKFFVIGFFIKLACLAVLPR